MKLYGTITSERATKGQGGNEYILIDILDEYRNSIGCIRIIPDGTNWRISDSYNNQKARTFYIPKEEKGKHGHDNTIIAIKNYPQCQLEEKGKRQKGNKCLYNHDCENNPENCIVHN